MPEKKLRPIRVISSRWLQTQKSLCWPTFVIEESPSRDKWIWTKTRNRSDALRYEPCQHWCWCFSLTESKTNKLSACCERCWVTQTSDIAHGSGSASARCWGTFAKDFWPHSSFCYLLLGALPFYVIPINHQTMMFQHLLTHKYRGNWNLSTRGANSLMRSNCSLILVSFCWQFDPDN